MLEMAHWIASTELATGEGAAEKRADYERRRAAAESDPPWDPVPRSWYRGSAHWYRRLVEAGDTPVAFFTQHRWEHVSPRLLNLLRGLVRDPMPPVRNVNAVGMPAILELVNKDPFFRVGDMKGYWSVHQVWNSSTRESRRLGCRRDKGQVFIISGEQRLFVSPNFPNMVSEWDLDYEAALGGLLTLSHSRSRFFDRTKWHVHSIESVYGQPFPLGGRFGTRYRVGETGSVRELHCISYDNVDRASGTRTKGGAMCHWSHDGMSHISVRPWNAPSGCFEQLPVDWGQPES